MIEIVQTPPLNSVQDLGRFGARHYGVGTSGAMDDVALATGNLLLGNPAGAAGIEIQMFPFLVKFRSDVAVAITGADCRARLDGTLLPPWWSTNARAGQSLVLQAPATGARSYLAVAGGVDVPVVLGSRSTCLRIGYGGHRGRALEAGDRLACGASPQARQPQGGIGAEPPEAALAAAAVDGARDVTVLRVVPAAEHDAFPESSRRAFWQEAWTVSAQSNRMGFRLMGTPLHLDQPLEIRSSGIVPGIVQVPPSGQPIIQLRDANSAGGYPKIGVVIDADLWRLGQARPGAKLRFASVTQQQAAEVQRETQAYLAEVEALARLCRYEAQG
jgi:biotin-dependent carboxylase-like uncharacterized protein